MQMSSTMSTLSAVYTKQSQRVSAAHGAGWPPSLDDATGAGPFPAREAGLGQQIHISQDARLRALGLDGELDQVPPMLKDKLQGNLLDMMLERLTGERGGDQAFTYPSATADMFGWFAERYGVPRPPRHRPQSFGATMASITAQSQSVQFSAQALVSDSEGKDVQLSVELAMAKTSVGVSVAALQNTQMSGAQIASFGGLSSRATQASFQFNLGVLWNGLSATSAGSGAESSEGEGNLSTFDASPRNIQRAFFRSVNARYNDVDSPPTAERRRATTSSVAQGAATQPPVQAMTTAVPESANEEIRETIESATKLPKATKRWVA